MLRNSRPTIQLGGEYLYASPIFATGLVDPFQPSAPARLERLKIAENSHSHETGRMAVTPPSPSKRNVTHSHN
jgi:hypothetical protein